MSACDVVFYTRQFSRGTSITAYDSTVLQKYADQLYRRARWSAVKWAFYGFLIALMGGGGVLVLFVATSHQHLDGRISTPSNVFLGLGVLFGAAYGWEKAFSLRLEAQRTLCQERSERNTRPVSGQQEVKAARKGKVAEQPTLDLG